jgi:hypothetical protein
MARRRSAPANGRPRFPREAREKTAGCGLEANMGRLAVVSWLVVVGISSGHAEEINTRKLTLAGVSDCLAEAIATNSAVDDGSVNTAHH